MTESYAIDVITNEIDKTESNITIDILSREYGDSISQYTLSVIAIATNQSFSTSTLKNLMDKFISSPSGEEFKVIGTKKEIEDLSGEILTIECLIDIE